MGGEKMSKRTAKARISLRRRKLARKLARREARGVSTPLRVVSWWWCDDPRCGHHHVV